MFGEEFAMVVDSVFDGGEFVHKSSDTMELNYGLSLAQKKSEFELCHRKDTIHPQFWHFRCRIKRGRVHSISILQSYNSLILLPFF